MLYVRRDQDRKIIALLNAPEGGATEKISPQDPEVLEFVQRGKSAETPSEFLSYTDNHLARVVEDLIDLLIDKNLIMLTELPADAQAKLSIRQKARRKLHQDAPLMVEDKDIL